MGDFDLDQINDVTFEALLGQSTVNASASSSNNAAAAAMQLSNPVDLVNAHTSGPVVTDSGGLDSIGLDDLPDLLEFAEAQLPLEKQLQQPQAQQPILPQLPPESSLVLNPLLEAASEAASSASSSDVTNSIFEHLITDNSTSAAPLSHADPFFFGGNVIFQEAIPPPPEIIREQQHRTSSRSSEDEELDSGQSTFAVSEADTEIEASPASSGSTAPLEEDDDDTINPAATERYRTSSGDSKVSAEVLRREQDPSLCLVCGEKAGKHSYYGGRVCPSCRAFFRRAVQSKYYEIFFCVKGEQCEITLKTRRSCQFCRFKRCLESGMRIAWVLPDGERNRRFNKLNKTPYRNALTHAKGSSSNSVALGAALAQQKQLTAVKKVPRPLLIVSREDMNEIQNTVHTLGMSTCKNMFAYFSNNADFMKQLASACYFGGKLDFHFQSEFDKMCDFFTEEHFTALEEFKSLPIEDRRELISKNGRIIKSFKNSLCIHDTESCFCKGIERATKSRKYPWLEEINEKLNSLQLVDRKPQIMYQQLFPSPWAANYEDETRHYELTLKMRNWPRDSENSPIDDILIILMKLIIGFSSDFVTLKRRDIVEKAQLRYISMLHKYLVYKYGRKANSRMQEGLMMMAYAREADEILQRRLPV